MTYFPHDWSFVWGIHLLSTDSLNKGPIKRWFDALLFESRNKLLNKIVELNRQSSCGLFDTPDRPREAIVMILGNLVRIHI